MRQNDWTKILGWPGYAVFQQEIDEKARTLKLWVRRKRGNRRLICSGCGRRIAEPADTTEREVRDLPWGEFRTTVVIELYRVRCPDCGLKIEKVDHLPSKAPYYLKNWTLQLRWQRVPAFEKLAHLLIDHVDGILNHCRTKVRFGVVEAINGNIKSLLRRGRGYKAQRMAVTKTEFVVFRKVA